MPQYINGYPVQADLQPSLFPHQKEMIDAVINCDYAGQETRVAAGMGKFSTTGVETGRSPTGRIIDETSVVFTSLPTVPIDKRQIEGRRDYHAEAAAKLFNVPLEEVTPEQRKTAKDEVFRRIYGVTKMLRNGGAIVKLGLSVEETEQVFKRFSKAFPRIAEAAERCKVMAQAMGKSPEKTK